MKQITLLATTLFTTFVFSQEIKTSSDKISFSHGSFDAIVVTIPYGNKDIIEKELKSEMTGAENTTVQKVNTPRKKPK
jgi:tRNA G10  N-methylase Trm11